jgi:hypothetical protein
VENWDAPFAGDGVRTYRILIEAADGALASEVRLVARNAQRAHDVALRLLERDKAATIADIYEDGQRIDHITRADPFRA